jgi:retron-type reverse transcriptase
MNKRKYIQPKRETFKPPNGRTINQLQTYISELQAQLAEAIRRQEMPEITRLIRSMVRSKDCMAHAVQRTISSTGAKSKGYKDTSRPVTQKAYNDLMQHLWKIIKHPGSYKASPLRRIYIPKSNGGLRPISIPTYVDRALQHLYLIVLDVFQEEQADRNSYGFRKFRSPGWASKAVTLTFWQRKSNPFLYAVQLDIEKCFDSISHDFILENCTTTKIAGQPIEVIPGSIARSWLKQGFIDLKGELSLKDKLNPTEEGVPQGGPISPVISNMVLNGIEALVVNIDVQPPKLTRKGIPTPGLIDKSDKLVWSHNGYEYICTFGCDQPRQVDHIIKSTPRYDTKFKVAIASSLLRQTGKSIQGWSYKKVGGKLNPFEAYMEKKMFQYTRLIRFADDSVLFVDNKFAKEKAIEKINNFLIIRGLRLNQSKTKTKILTTEPFTFCGYEFRSKIVHGKQKIYNYPPTEKIVDILTKARNALNSSETPFHNFRRINAILRGWLNFYRCANSSKIFSYIKHRLFHMVRIYLFKFLSRDKRFKGKKKKLLTKKIYQTMWQNYLIRQDPRLNQRWWGLPKEQNPSTGRYKNKPYFLVNPGTVPVATPSIIIGKNAYHPQDRAELLIKATGWTWGLRGKVLKKSNGICAYCGCALAEGNETGWQVHHIKSIKLGGDNHLTNLVSLCTPCHKEITKCERTLDPIKLPELIGKGLLTNLLQKDSSKPNPQGK